MEQLINIFKNYLSILQEYEKKWKEVYPNQSELSGLHLNELISQIDKYKKYLLEGIIILEPIDTYIPKIQKVLDSFIIMMENIICPVEELYR